MRAFRRRIPLGIESPIGGQRTLLLPKRCSPLGTREPEEPALIRYPLFPLAILPLDSLEPPYQKQQ